MSNEQLRELLLQQAAEIAKEGHAGWGNTMLAAAEALAEPEGGVVVSDKYALLRGHLPELIEEAARKGGINPRAQMIIDLLADYDALQSRLDSAERRDSERTEEIEILQRQLDRFRNQSHGIPALAEHERLRQQLSEHDALLREAQVYVLESACLGAGKAQDLDERIDALLSSAEPVSQWIAVTDRLPDEHKESYLCLFADGYQQVTEFLYDDTEGWCFWYGDPTHWMPLPAEPAKPAKGGDGEDGSDHHPIPGERIQGAIHSGKSKWIVDEVTRDE